MLFDLGFKELQVAFPGPYNWVPVPVFGPEFYELEDGWFTPGTRLGK